MSKNCCQHSLSGHHLFSFGELTQQEKDAGGERVIICLNPLCKLRVLTTDKLPIKNIERVKKVSHKYINNKKMINLTAISKSKGEDNV